ERDPALAGAAAVHEPLRERRVVQQAELLQAVEQFGRELRRHLLAGQSLRQLRPGVRAAPQQPQEVVPRAFAGVAGLAQRSTSTGLSSLARRAGSSPAITEVASDTAQTHATSNHCSSTGR